MAQSAMESLLDILRDHDIVFDRDAITSAFADVADRQAIQGWMELYLGQDTLLTKEEATLYKSLLKSGDIDSGFAAQDTALVQSMSEAELAEAVEELKRSTAAIEKQTETLKLQHNAMSTLVKNNAHASKTRSQMDANQIRRWDIEKSQIKQAVEELTETLNYQCLDSEQQIISSENAVKQTLDCILKSDNKLLSSLQKLSGELEPGQSGDDILVSKIRDLCARLIKHTVDGVRTKLDRIYLTALQEPVAEIHGDEQPPEGAEMQEELESLYAEILPVSQMATEQQYLEPALKEIEIRSGFDQVRNERAVEYMHGCLTFLVDRLQAFLERAEQLRSHHSTVQTVTGIAKRAMEDVQPHLSKTDSFPASRPRKDSAPASPIRSRHARQRSSLYIDDEVEPEQHLLRNLGIYIPPDVASDAARVELLERAVQERTSKLEGHTYNVQKASEKSISSYLRDAQSTLQLLRDSLHVESLYGKVQLLDVDTESAIHILEKEVEDLQNPLTSIDLRKLQDKNVRRDELVQRWSR
ncbi:hypothetical protein BP6252_12705 [Coleophoma cylindrospora]|uniref:HAUS augmin-like complex subunit 3 N-terminal domain-containing protein n=1 Tax=Coleophoma cylindrospora TaxID=1849047 RepID=A0A3D8QDD2_9HELO|nr:hypothetical protein BP6252_12705 [Coleophoma cylindrospora]